MGIFKHDDAIILGWLCGEYFLAPDSTNIYGSYGNDYGVSWSDDFPSTGSGNFPVGEAGKKAYATNDNASLCGSGGSIYGGGLGQKYGTFGFGGNGRGYTSSGGGGGSSSKMGWGDDDKYKKRHSVYRSRGRSGSWWH